jgi:methyl-accepting chemotaxis protein
MKPFTISRRLLVLLGAFGLMTALAVAGFTLRLRQSSARSAAVTAQAMSQQALSYEILEALAENHGRVQQLLGLKDPDEQEVAVQALEVSQNKTLALLAADCAAFAPLQPKYEILRGAEQSVVEEVLRGNAALAREKFFDVAAKNYDVCMTQLHEQRNAMQAATTRLLERHSAAARKKLLHQSGGLAVVLTCLLAFGWRLKAQIVRVLTAVSATVADTSTQISASANHFAQGSQALAGIASEQAASLEETSASLEEISAMTKRNAENADHGKVLSSQARHSATAGLGRLGEMSRTLHTIKTAVTEMEDAVQEMQGSSQEIAKIIKTIDEIAFQTNLLALNAAVEAARAGEAGAGFAVVADEVRALAQRSAQAARDTSEKIEAAVKRSERGGIASAKVVRSLGEVQGTATNLGQVFQGIATQIKSLDEVIAEIATASKEQNQGIGEVNLAVSQMDKVTQSNAASAEENAGVAEEMSSQAVTLQGIVEQLQQVVGGGGNAPVAPSEPKTPPSVPAPTLFRRPKPVLGITPATAQSRPADTDRDYPMPEPIGAGPQKNGFTDF